MDDHRSDRADSRSVCSCFQRLAGGGARATQHTHACSSIANIVLTNGASFVAADFCPEITLTHSRLGSVRIMATITTSAPVTAAAGGSVKVSRRMGPAAASGAARAREPEAGFGWGAFGDERGKARCRDQRR